MQHPPFRLALLSANAAAYARETLPASMLAVPKPDRH